MLHDVIEKDSSVIFKYQFDLKVKEQILNNIDQKLNKIINTSNREKKTNYIKFNAHKLPKIKSLLFFILFFTVYAGITLFIIFYNIQFLDKYKNTAQYAS